MIVWLKIAHIAALVIWCGGLIALPSLFVGRRHISGPQMRERFQRLIRATFIRVTSPAAFVAIVTGTGLIFARGVSEPWMMLKLAGVGALVMLHVRFGYVLTHLYEFDRPFARWRQVLATGATVTAIAFILTLVLAKPRVETDILPQWMHQPGGLHSLVYSRSPTP